VDLTRLFHPRSVAVVGANERAEGYASQTLLNLAKLGFEGDVWGVNPRRESAHGVPCFPSLSALPGVPDAVVIGIPAAGVPAVVEEAAVLGCGGAVVYAAGFAEGGDTALEASLVAAAAGGAPNAGVPRGVFPVVGPNCDGIVALHSRAALWGDALARPEPGPVALVSQSGNLAVNALATRRGLRLHTVISSGNESVVGAADYLSFLADEDGVRSVALLLERDGDGAQLCEALASCADAGVGVAVLKVGSSSAGAAAAAAHTGALAGDQRVFRALVEEAGAAWAADVHDLLELAKAMAARGRKPRAGGLAILTCSGGDSGMGADEAARAGVDLPVLAAETVSALRERLPAAATVANPLDYTALIWGEVETLRDLIGTVGADPVVGQVLVFFDWPPGIGAASWAAVQEGILAGAGVSPAGVIVASTVPELLDDAAAWRSCEAGVPAVAGLRTGIACAAALATPAADPARLREIAAAAAPRDRSAGAWLAEHEAKARLRAAGVPVVPGRVVAGEEDAVAALAELGGPVAVKRSAPGLLHKRGALALGVAHDDEARAAYRRLATENGSAHANGSASVLVERMAAPGAELIVSVRRDGVVPALVVGIGGVHAELLDDVAIVPLPVTAHRAERAIAGLRGAPLLRDKDIPAAARLATQLADLDLDLIECNPVLVHRHGAVVVDAVAKETAP
jgi:acetate---CoA ligase (ADP-forming)